MLCMDRDLRACLPCKLGGGGCRLLHDLDSSCPPACSKQLEGETEVSKLEALQWVHALLSRDARLLQEQRQLLLLALCDALGAASGEAPPALPPPLLLLLLAPAHSCSWPAWTVCLLGASSFSRLPEQPGGASLPPDRVVTESLAVLASVAEEREHFPAVMAALLDCFRGNGGARLLQVGRGPAWAAAGAVVC